MKVEDAKVLPTKYEAHGDTSVAWGRWTQKMTPKSGGDPVSMEGRFTPVAKKIGGKWYYVVDHASAPLPAPPPASK